ncbi:MAG: hypothetical protein ACU843_00660 [Gammaproteobacteria bacterium]
MVLSKANAIAIRSDADYRDAQIALTRKSYPEVLLRRLMQALENYRGSRKIGWSRPWNKVGVRNFQSFRLSPEDNDLQRAACALLDLECAAIPKDARAFLDELLYRQSAPMGFVFLTEVEDGEERFEGAVLSYGRIHEGNRRFRDRCDILLESKIVDGVSVGLSRIRIFVDPYRGPSLDPLWSATIDSPETPTGSELFEQIARLSSEWGNIPTRRWSHWVMEYIDYFGPRQWSLRSSFFCPGEPSDRLYPTLALPASDSGRLQQAVRR